MGRLSIGFIASSYRKKERHIPIFFAILQTSPPLNPRPRRNNRPATRLEGDASRQVDRKFQGERFGQDLCAVNELVRREPKFGLQSF
jgi:hypothetical protein